MLRLDLEALHVLDTVATEGSFAKAAAKLNRAQSAVSYQIRKLETALKVRLFNREGYRARLTPAGESLLAEGRALLAQARRVEALAESFKKGWEPRLEVVLDGILPMDPIMDALKAMADARIPTRIQVKVDFLGGVQERFEEDGADLMLVMDFRRGPGLTARALPEVERVLVAGADHTLVGLGEVTLSDLRSFVELTIQDSSPGRATDFTSRLFGGERVFYLSDFQTKRQALLKGLGFGWMPAHLVAGDLASGAMRELVFAGGSRSRFTPYLVHPADRPLGRAGRALEEALLSRIGEGWSGS